MNDLNRADQSRARRCDMALQPALRHRPNPLSALNLLRVSLTTVLLTLYTGTWAHASQYRADSPLTGQALSAPSEQATYLIGLSAVIPIDTEYTGSRVAQLWQRFQALPTLHYSVKGPAPIDVYALYTGFNPDSGVLTLTIGYREDALLRPNLDKSWARQLLPGGEYVNVSEPVSAHSASSGTTPEAQVRRGWQALAGQRLPTAIMERYRLSADGTMDQAEVLVLY